MFENNANYAEYLISYRQVKPVVATPLVVAGPHYGMARYVPVTTARRRKKYRVPAPTFQSHRYNDDDDDE